VSALEIDHEEPTRGHGITEVGDERGFISPDGANLFSPERTEHAPAVRHLAEMLYHEDRSRYLGIIRSALFELPSEVEEDGAALAREPAGRARLPHLGRGALRSMHRPPRTRPGHGPHRRPSRAKVRSPLASPCKR
jgi:hypothetical protein